jgi:hypothetical protein
MNLMDELLRSFYRRVVPANCPLSFRNSPHSARLSSTGI